MDNVVAKWSEYFIADLNRLLCKLPTDALITILSGDFNVNVKKRDKQSDSLLKLVKVWSDKKWCITDY
jgi:lipid A disaccharide synthetase